MSTVCPSAFVLVFILLSELKFRAVLSLKRVEFDVKIKTGTANSSLFTDAKIAIRFCSTLARAS